MRLPAICLRDGFNSRRPATRTRWCPGATRCASVCCRPTRCVVRRLCRLTAPATLAVSACSRSSLCSEKNLDNVLQSTTVYANVSKVPCRGPAAASRPHPLLLCTQGVLANKEDLQKVFGTKDEARICVVVRVLAATEAAVPVCLASEHFRSRYSSAASCR